MSVGIVILHHKKHAATSSSTNSPVTQTDPNDPSTFVKNPLLRQSFWGMAYTPEGSLLPNCGSTLSTYFPPPTVFFSLLSLYAI